MIGDKTVYDHFPFYFYIKTEDPDLNFYWDWRNCFFALKGRLFPTGNYSFGPREFCEVGEGIDVIKKVDDGYVCTFMFDSEPGENAIIIVRGANVNQSGEVVASFKIMVHGYDEAEQKFIRQLIEQHTTADMSDREKLRAICDYIRFEGFVYNPNYENRLIPTLIGCGAYWDCRRIDCVDAAHIMKLCGEALGYETEIIQMDGGHEYTVIYIDGEAVEYDACPLASTGILNPNTIQKIKSWEDCPGTPIKSE